LVIAEVKSGDPCSLNGPWTNPSKQNINHVLGAIGITSPDYLEEAALALYASGYYVREDALLRIRLVAFGARRSSDLTVTFPDVPQLTWPEVLLFIHDRLNQHKNQKKDRDQWSDTGKLLYDCATELPLEQFVTAMKHG